LVKVSDRVLYVKTKGVRCFLEEGDVVRRIVPSEENCTGEASRVFVGGKERGGVKGGGFLLEEGHPIPRDGTS
jgi:hypothetical protein